METLEYPREPSDRDPQHTYIVTVVDGEPVSCHCLDWLITMRQTGVEAYTCKHMLRAIAKQAV